MDPVMLATTVVVQILRPYIEQGAKKIGEVVSDKVGKAAADFATETASKAWDYIKSAFQSEDEKSALNSFEKRPKASEELLKEVLTEKLEQDRELAQKLEKLVKAKDPEGRTSAQIITSGITGFVNVQGDVSGSGNTITGQVYNAAPAPAASQKDTDPRDDPSKHTK